MREAAQTCARWRGAPGRARSPLPARRRVRRRSSSRSRSRSRGRTGAGAGQHVRAQRPLARVGARSSSPVILLIAQRAKPTARPNPPPSRRAKAATARSQSPASTALGARGEVWPPTRRGRRRRGRSSAHPGRARAVEQGRLGGRHRPALFRALSLSSLPASSAPASLSPATWSHRVEPSSAATITRAPGNARPSARTVSAIRSASSRAATMTTNPIRLGRLLSGALRTSRGKVYPAAIAQSKSTPGRIQFGQRRGTHHWNVWKMEVSPGIRWTRATRS